MWHPQNKQVTCNLDFSIYIIQVVLLDENIKMFTLLLLYINDSIQPFHFKLKY